jgi:uncharacterized protein YecT (DUF1311 family)
LWAKKMKVSLVVAIIFIAVHGFGQTQLDINEEAYLEYEKADKEMNSVYHKILTEYKADTIFLKNLKVSQRVWLKFRDAEVKVKFPDRPAGYYGSIQPLCNSQYLKELTETRIKSLKYWLHVAEDGDPCSGSRMPR